MKKFQWNYELLQEGDVFFSKGANIVGNLICWITKSAVNHAGFITADHGQFFATEMSPNGIQEVSLERYCKSNNQIIDVYRWNEMSDEDSRNKLGSILALLRRKQKEYDWWTLVASWPMFRWMHPKDKDKAEICSELVYRTLVELGYDRLPLNWEKFPPSPGALLNFLAKDLRFSKVEFKNG